MNSVCNRELLWQERRESKKQQNIFKGQHKNTLEDGTPVDPTFKGISRTTNLFRIWRVQNLKLVPVPKDQYGTFYDGDSYIVYAASEFGKYVGPHTKPREIKGKIEMHIHFWLGSTTSQDEGAVAAFKSVELDNYLGGKPVQHREVQGNESARFKAYFKNGIRLLLGGYDSGLKSLNNNFEPRLFRVKGRKRPVVTQMPAVSWEYFNSGDVFIIDTKDVVFVWIGRTSNHLEKILGAKVATQFRDERNALSIVFVDDGKEMEMSIPEQTLLGFYLDLRPLAKRIMPEANVLDEAVELEVRSTLKLYHCSDAEGIYKVIEVKTGTLNQTDLDFKDSYIIDNGPYHIWVWIGREASPKERVEAMRNANGFLKKKNYPISCRVSRIVDGGEPTEFKALFNNWKDRKMIQTVKNNKNNVPTIKPPPLTALNIAALEKNPLMAAQEQLLDDGSGNLILWRVSEGHLQEVPEKFVLYSSEMYYILYKYIFNGESKEILYHWMGSASKDIPAKTLLTLSQEDPIAKATVKGRIIHNYEPPHFLTAFKGKLVVINGDYKEDLPNSYLLQVEGNQIFNSYAKQKSLQRSSLNSGHVYLLKSEGEAYLWCGKASTGDQREVAKNIAQTLVKEFLVIFEGQEKQEFWKHLSEGETHHSLQEVDSVPKIQNARLFLCSRHKGTLKVEEVMDFSQNDLSSEDSFLLDTFHSILVWTGKYANREDKTKGWETALDYLKSDPSKRELSVPIIWMKQGFEPPLFTGFFSEWDPFIWKKEQRFEEIREEIDRQKPLLQVDLIVTDSLPNFYECEKYPLSTLLERDPEKLPAGVDVQHKELFLSADEFFYVFSMKYSEFVNIPKWKQEYLKKNVGLF